MTREVEKLTMQVLDEVKAEPTFRRLMTVSGVGPLAALAFRATIDQPGRFRKLRDLSASLGLTLRRYQSGEADLRGRISRCGDKLAPTQLYESGTLAADLQQQVVFFTGVGDNRGQTPRHVTHGNRPDERGTSPARADVLQQLRLAEHCRTGWGMPTSLSKPPLQLSLPAERWTIVTRLFKHLAKSVQCPRCRQRFLPAPKSKSTR